jgi:amino acid transporter
LSIIDFLLGRPIASYEERAEQIGIAAGVPIFGMDALSSVAYGPEAALTLLIPLGLAGVRYIVPLSLSVITLLVIVFFSYRQTIAAYPGGGGSYTVAHRNLGTLPGLLAAAALMIDYVLTAAVGISAGIGALISAVPALHAETLTLCLVALALITLANLRGVREAGGIFMLPTYLFLLCMFAAIAIGGVKTLLSGGHPVAIVPPPAPPAAVEAVTLWLLLKAFASGCSAMTGIEAVSNGSKAFRKPTVPLAQRTLAVVIVSLVVMLAGMAFLSRAYHIAAIDPNSAAYQSVLSMIFAAVAGRGWFYYLSIGCVLLVLIFSANTAFTDFPRVCRAIAEDRFLPVSFANRGRRLVYSEGILVLAVLTAVLLVVFGGVTDRLIPLYAVGAFLAFTLSQAGMVAHWRKQKNPSFRNISINALGALATGATVMVVIVAKFTEGAWITVVIIPALLALMYSVRRHYDKVGRAIASPTPVDLSKLTAPLVVVPMPYWSKIAKQALRAALEISHDVKALYVIEENKHEDDFCREWETYVVKPARQAKVPAPELVQLKTPYRFVISPIVDYVIELSQANPDRRIIAIVPELVEKELFGYFLHTQRATLLKAMLLIKGNDRISVLNIPWYLK